MCGIFRTPAHLAARAHEAVENREAQKDLLAAT
jgi:hypothetical protein